MNDTFDNSPTGWTPIVHAHEAVLAHERMRLPELIASAYRSATANLRAQILEQLLRPVGLLGLASLAAGAFLGFLRRGDYQGLVIQPEDVGRISGDQLLELALYVEQRSPETFASIAQLLADNPSGLIGVGGSLLLLALHRGHHREAP